MKQSKILSVLLAVLTACLVLSSSVAVPILCRPFYYAHIGPLGLVQATGLTEEAIRQAYDEMLDFCLCAPEFSTGALSWSQSGRDHFADVRVLFLLDLAVLAIGAFVSVNLLFKVAIFRVENFDHSTPADTGIYTEDEIVSALNIEKNSNLFSFSTAEKTKELQAQFPYLDKVEVTVQMPATVVVQLTPATERFTCMYSGGWMVLSDALRILRLEVSQPEGLILLNAKLPDNFSPAIGQQVIPETYNSLLVYTESSAESDSTDATPESAQPTVTDIVTQLWQLLQDDGLLDGLTALDISDTSQLSFTYQGRVDVLLGNSSSLDYKLRLAAKILTDPDKGLSGSDRGTLDVSDQLEDGEIRGYFQPYEQPTPTPEPAPEPDPESENAENAEEPPTE